MSAGDEIVGMENQNSRGVIDDADFVCESADYVDGITFFDGGGDPVITEVESAGSV